jgi:hypothetical protein
MKNGAPGAIRTRDLSLRRRILYPAELRAHFQIVAISFLTRRSALGHSLVTPLTVWINGLLEVPDFPVFSARFEPLLDFFGGQYSIQLSYRRIVGVAILLADGERRPASRALPTLHRGLQL